jgi:hypothetical protein
VVFSVESAFQQVVRRDLMSDNRSNVSRGQQVPFWQVCEELSNAAQPYDVLFFPDGELRPDTLSPEHLGQYRTVILPDCHHLTPHQAEALHAYLVRGGRLVVVGEIAANLPGSLRAALLDHERTSAVGDDAFCLSHLPDGPQVSLHTDADVAINIQRVAEGAALHVIHYEYDEAQDAVLILPEVVLDVRLEDPFNAVRVYSPAGAPTATMTPCGGAYRVTMRDVPLYSVAVLSQAE